MEKRLLVFLLLAFGIFFIWGKIMPKQPPVEPDKSGETDRPATGTSTSGGGTGSGETAGNETAGGTGEGETAGGTAEAEATPGARAYKRVPEKAGSRTQATGRKVRWTFDSWGGSVAGADLMDFAKKPNQDLADPLNWYPALSATGLGTKNGFAPRSLTIRILDADGRVALPLDQVLWELEEKSDARLVYALDLPEAGVRLTKVFDLPSSLEGAEGEPYHLDFSLRLEVTDAAKAARYGAEGWRIRLRAASGMPREQSDLDLRVKGALLYDGTVDVEEVGPPSGSDEPPEILPEEPREGIRVAWVGIHSRFFAALLLSKDPGDLVARRAIFPPFEAQYVPGDEIGTPIQGYTNLSADLDFTLPLPVPGMTAERNFLFYVGPMDPDILSVGPYTTLEPVIDYGLLGFIAKILVFLLGVIQSVVSNWGVAIILLTLVVRMAMFPLSRKSQVSMQRYQKQMARLKPKIDQIKERYKNNKQKAQQEQMKMMREEGVRMVPAGCLVMFLQMPIFIGLFQALRYSIGLRHAGFLWATDLTAPDRLALIASKGIPILGTPFYLNVFPILMGITWYLSAAMAPKPADPQQAQTQKMMKWMPVIFSIFLYSYAAGLALYMVVSSTWSIFEMKVVRKILAKPEEEVVAPAASTTFRKGR